MQCKMQWSLAHMLITLLNTHRKSWFDFWIVEKKRSLSLSLSSPLFFHFSLSCGLTTVLFDSQLSFEVLMRLLTINNLVMARDSSSFSFLLFILCSLLFRCFFEELKTTKKKIRLKFRYFFLCRNEEGKKTKKKSIK